MPEEKTLGLLLTSRPYLGQKKLLQVFTPGFGLISFMLQSKKLAALAAPFCLGEWVFRQGTSDLYTLLDGSLLDPMLDLKTEYTYLTAAGQIAQDLLRTQLSLKKGDGLFQLVYQYMRHIPAAPAVMASGFKLKLLLHEGLFSEELHPSFSKEEWDTVLQLALVRKISLLQQIKDVPHEKIKLLFESRTERDSNP